MNRSRHQPSAHRPPRPPTTSNNHRHRQLVQLVQVARLRAARAQSASSLSVHDPAHALSLICLCLLRSPLPLWPHDSLYDSLLARHNLFLDSPLTHSAESQAVCGLALTAMLRGWQGCNHERADRVSYYLTRSCNLTSALSACKRGGVGNPSYTLSAPIRGTFRAQSRSNGH